MILSKLYHLKSIMLRPPLLMGSVRVLPLTLSGLKFQINLKHESLTSLEKSRGVYRTDVLQTSFEIARDLTIQILPMRVKFLPVQ